MVEQLGVTPCTHNLESNEILPCPQDRYKTMDSSKDSFEKYMRKARDDEVKSYKRYLGRYGNPKYLKYLPSNISKNTTIFNHEQFKGVNPHAQCWVMTSRGLLKAVNLDKRTAMHSMQTAQPSREANFLAMCTPRPESIIGCNRGGYLYKLKNGVYHLLGSGPNFKNTEPVIMEQLPSYYENKLYLYPESEPTLASNQLITINKDCSILYNDKWLSSFTLGSSNQYNRNDKYLRAGCINQNTVTTGGNHLSATRKDIETGLVIWEAYRKTGSAWWAKNAQDENNQTCLSMITDKANPENCFYVCKDKGYIHKYDVRASTGGGRPVLELHTHQTKFVDLFKKKNETINKLIQINTAPHQVIGHGNQDTMAVFDVRKFVTYEQMTTKYAAETFEGYTDGTNSCIKNYRFPYSLPKNSESKITAFDFLGPTKRRPGLIATGHLDGMLRIWDAKTQKLWEQIYLNDTVTSVFLTPGIQCFQDRDIDHVAGIQKADIKSTKKREMTAEEPGPSAKSTKKDTNNE